MMLVVTSVVEDTPQQGIKRTLLQKFDVPNSNYETVLQLAEIEPNVVIGRHSHSGPEAGYLLEGDVTIEFDDQPAQTVRTGQSYYLPADLVHAGRWGAAGSKVLFIWVVEKGKPFREWVETPAWRSPPEA